jgi:hypothetical protein
MLEAQKLYTEREQMQQEPRMRSAGVQTQHAEYGTCSTCKVHLGLPWAAAWRVNLTPSSGGCSELRTHKLRANGGMQDMLRTEACVGG